MTYTDQPIFDAIAAATRIENDYGGQSTQAVVIDVKKFIEVFNNHQDRALCVSVGVAQAAPDLTSKVVRLRYAIIGYLEVFDRCGGSESVSPETFAAARQDLRDALSFPSTYSRCAKCGCETQGEAALVEGAVWCHPCADSVPSTVCECKHKSFHDGPRVEMRWGTAPTQVCDCGMWRTNLHVPGVWRAPPITSAPEGGGK